MPTQHRKRFFAMLDDISEQVEWPVWSNGSGEYVASHLDKMDWRLIICAGFMKETRVAQGIDGGQVMLGLRLRDIFKDLDDNTAREMAGELIEFTGAFGAAHGVVFRDEPQRNA